MDSALVASTKSRSKVARNLHATNKQLGRSSCPLTVALLGLLRSRIDVAFVVSFPKVPADPSPAAPISQRVRFRVLQSEGLCVGLHWIGGNGRDIEGRGDFPEIP